MEKQVWEVMQDGDGFEKGQILEAAEGKHPVGDGYWLTSRSRSVYCSLAGGCYVCPDQSCPVRGFQDTRRVQS